MIYGRKKLKMSKNKFWATKGYLDYTTIFLLFVMLAFGVLMVYSASSYRATMDGLPSTYFATRQIAIGGGSFIIMLILSCFNYQKFRGKIAQTIIMIGMLTAASIALFIGISSNGSKRWIEIAGIRVQPPEFVKTLIILYIPNVCVRKPYALDDWKEMFYATLPCLASIGLIAKENLSTAVVCFAIMFIIMFVAAPRVNKLLALGAGGVAAALLFITTVGYRSDRIDAFFHPETSEHGYQTMQSLYAIGSGGLFGKGLGESIQKMGYLPEPHNDMIFAVICEELGLFGALCVIALFGALLFQLRFIANHARDRYGALIIVGVLTHIAVQMIVNIGVVTNLVPNTGVTLPFISYGGSSLLFLFVEMSVVLAISRQMIPYEVVTDTMDE